MCQSLPYSLFFILIFEDFKNIQWEKTPRGLKKRSPEQKVEWSVVRLCMQWLNGAVDKSNLNKIAISRITQNYDCLVRTPNTPARGSTMCNKY